MVRTFVAIDLPEEIRERVRKSQAILAQSGGRLALVDPANLHVTLKFLGEVEPGKIGAIIEALRAVRAAPFELTVRCAACNSPRRPRVVWCDITDAGESAALARQVDDLLEPLGFPRERRPFRPHATLARVKVPPRSSGNCSACLADRSGGSGWRASNSEERLRPRIGLRGPRGGSALTQYLRGGGTQADPSRLRSGPTSGRWRTPDRGGGRSGWRSDDGGVGRRVQPSGATGTSTSSCSSTPLSRGRPRRRGLPWRRIRGVPVRPNEKYQPYINATINSLDIDLVLRRRCH